MAGSATISRGNVINTIVLTVNLSPVSVAANQTVEQNFTVPGLVSSDQISAFEFQGAYTNSASAVNFRVASANTLTVAFQNTAGAAQTPPAGNYYLEVNRIENLPAPAGIA